MDIKTAFTLTESTQTAIKEAYSKEIQNKQFIKTFFKLPKNKKVKNTGLIVDIGGTTLKLAFYKNGISKTGDTRKIPTKFTTEKEFYTWVYYEIDLFLKLNYPETTNNSIKGALVISYELVSESISSCYVKSYSKKLVSKFVDQEPINPLQFLNELLKEKVEFVCCMNDTVATILSHIPESKERYTIGLVYGTGLNIAIPDSNGEIFNTEIGSFDHKSIPKNEIDRILFKVLENKNKDINILETMSAGYISKLYIDKIKESSDTENIKYFYKRAFQLLSPLIKALSKKYNTKNYPLTIILTGSPFTNNIVYKEVENEFYRYFGNSIELVFVKEATIEGAANSLDLN